MQTTPRIKAITVTVGISFWVIVLTTITDTFKIELIIPFVVILATLSQIFSVKLERVLNIFAKYNSIFFLGIVFVTLISIYGILFKLLRIDLLRLKKQEKTYWLNYDIIAQSSKETEY